MHAMLTFLSAVPLAGRTVAPLPEDVGEGCRVLPLCVGDVGFVPGLVDSDLSGNGDVMVSISVVSTITVLRVPEISVVMAVVVVIVVVTNVVVVVVVGEEVAGEEIAVEEVAVEEVAVEEDAAEEDEDDPGTIIKEG
jgi:hypothetical protein